MKYHFLIKLLALLLVACALVAGFGSVFVIVSAIDNGLYTSTPAEVEAQRISDWRFDQTYGLAHQILNWYTARELGGCTPAILEYTNRDFDEQEFSHMLGIAVEDWDYSIEDMNGQRILSNRKPIYGDLEVYPFHLSVDYPVHSIDPNVLRDDWQWRDYYLTENQEHFLYYYESPVYKITIRALPGTFDASCPTSFPELDVLYAARYWAIGVLATSFLVFILCAVYLCFAAGRSHRHNEIRLKGLTKLPLDVYGAAAGFGAAALIFLGVDLLDNILWADEIYIWGIVGSGALLFIAGLVASCWLYAVIAQFKMKNGSWWRKSLIGWCLRKLWKGVRFCFRGLRKLFRMLPLIWQWLLTAAAMVVVPLICLFFTASSHYGILILIFGFWTVVACVADVAIVCYGAYAFGTLLKGAKQMRQGDLNVKISTRYLFGAFRTFAEQLNALADTAKEAAQSQMKSERMKSELITNVSHDIKTPLTSLINYVDLLEKPHTEEEGKQYLEVLSRQSQKLKKLIDDLMDMSKASSGAMHVEITSVDAAEAVNQALGEFADKLEAAGLTPLFRQPEQPVNILADGRLVWRVLSNLLGNIVKYALPGTRVYVDLSQVNGIVRLSIKNISKEELNVSAEELTERFVRGDASRNTEGSGLGLNIAKSLMELQQGDLYLSVDGDLFKVVLTFPAP